MTVHKLKKMTDKHPPLPSVVKAGLETTILVNTLNSSLQQGNTGVDEILDTTEQAFKDINAVEGISIENVEIAEWREELYKTQQSIKGLQVQLQRLEAAHRKAGKQVVKKGFKPVTTGDYKSMMTKLSADPEDDPSIVER